METVSLFEELRLIERSEGEVNGAWKGAHLLLFFLAFVFGSFCTFCFHMLMYLFDEKCVLFPKLLSLTSLRHNVIYEFIPEEKERADMLPVDFLSTQWVEKSACYLPTYVPLVSGIFGLVWTTMFLMCSTGSTTGLQRPWRVIPPVFIFSLAMGGLCIYSSAITHYGLRELCIKLGEITGSSTCAYTVNVATLAYERKIRGVYQATRLTITSAWLHTGCWLASALLALTRILLAVDFRLVKVRVELVGDLDKMLERNEEQLRTISPYRWEEENTDSVSGSSGHLFQNKHNEIGSNAELVSGSTIWYLSERTPTTSQLSLVSTEMYKLARIQAYQPVSKEHYFIVDIIYNMVDKVFYPVELKSSGEMFDEETINIPRRFGQQALDPQHTIQFESAGSPFEPVNPDEFEEVQKKIRQELLKTQNRRLIEITSQTELQTAIPGTSQKRGRISFESDLNILPEIEKDLQPKVRPLIDDEKFSISHTSVDSGSSEKGYMPPMKEEPKTDGTQTEKKGKKDKTKYKVRISESPSMHTLNRSDGTVSTKDTETQTAPKEKQD